MNSRKLLQWMFVFILITLLLSGCGPGQIFGPTQTPIPPTSTNTPVPPTATTTPTPVPVVAGQWEAVLTFVVENNTLISPFSFKVSDDGTQIERWSIVDLVSGQLIGGGEVKLIGGTFTIENTFYQGNTKTSRTINGTFVMPDKVEGTYVVSYGSKGPYEGNWEGAPKP